MRSTWPVLTVVLMLAAADASASQIVPLTSLDLSQLHQGFGKPQVNHGLRSKRLSIAGRVFAEGLGTHARSVLWLELDGKVERFQATVGVDDGANSPKASVRFAVIGDGRKL